MNQYIITEEKLAEIESTPNEDTKDWLRIFYGLCDGVRSHPYNPREGMVWMTSEEEETRIRQAERETVLELLRLKYVEFLNHPCPELADKYKHCCDADWCGLCTLDEVLAELRQKAGEQCGDNCKGECSGEVTGTPFCPQSERDKVLDELEKRITEEEPVFLFTILGYIKELRRAGEP